MSLGIAILGLAVLVLVHEAGHFFAARAVGMTPRKFYLGFGPPLVKRVRGGVEYGIAALPLGGYVKIPGMHRPAPGDLRQTLPPAERDQLAPDLDELDAALERGDEAAALAVVERLKPHLGQNRQLQELEWALAPDAYWRQSASKKITVIGAGPATNIVLALVLFIVLFMLGQVQSTREDFNYGDVDETLWQISSRATTNDLPALLNLLVTSTNSADSVTPDIAEIISKWTGIPISKLVQSEM